ncbi:hypothetical protein WMY93_000124 [Mugilogobius chulae]|uniref:Uncharacterized protein n=1 Tax=Mugilogobius chulae TaxID=88201 RepID=A0AAW0Q018_9GOBI
MEQMELMSPLLLELEEERRKNQCYERAFEKIEEEQCNFQKVTEENQRAREEKQKEIAALKEQLEEVRKEKEGDAERNADSQARPPESLRGEETWRGASEPHERQKRVMKLHLERLRAGEEKSRTLQEKLEQQTKDEKKPADDLKSYMERQKRMMTMYLEYLDEEKKKSQALQKEVEEQKQVISNLKEEKRDSLVLRCYYAFSPVLLLARCPFCCALHVQPRGYECTGVRRRDSPVKYKRPKPDSHSIRALLNQQRRKEAHAL